ncbi:MAG TPA: N-acyl homoserine lactonase family protein [Acidimicrobiales bacterium]|nr:N-acyl homoserine lactonase family protein [Acidimicrobiales bacterium]
MTLPIRPISCGWINGDAGGTIAGMSGPSRIPVPAFLLEHPYGLVLFDSGLHPELASSTARMRGLDTHFTPELAPDGSIGPRLRAAGYDPADIAVIVTSHLHFDHCGGQLEVPNARVVVQRAEWDAACEPAAQESGAYNPADFDLGHDVQLLDGRHDLFGEGRILVEPTPGHTAGHQSLVIDGTHVLIGDACYCRLALDTDGLPPFAFDHALQRQGFAWLRQQESMGRQLLFSHDLEQWESLPAVIS